MKIDDILKSAPGVRREARERMEVTDQFRAAFWAAYREQIEQGPNREIELDTVRDVIKLLIQYVTNDPDFEANPLVANRADLRKGIWLVGEYGTGKTTLLKTFVRLNSWCKVPNPILGRWHSAHDITAMAERNESIPLDGVRSIILDDLGREHEAYGRYKAGVLIEQLYSKRIKLHASTNFKRAQLAEMYGDGAADRIASMCNMVVMPSKESFRR